MSQPVHRTADLALGADTDLRWNRPTALMRTQLLCVGVALSLLLACEGKMVIATWSCPAKADTSLLGTGGATGSSSSALESFELPWSTGFEDGFCDYESGGISCLMTGSGSKAIVTEPTHSGKYAAAYTIDTDLGNGQVRCIRQGPLPTTAYYGAWYYVPALAKNTALWNLIHFNGDNSFRGGHLWDVSLVNTDTGDLRLTVFSYLTSIPDQTNNPAIPIGEWFHIEFYLKRASDETGEVIVYQDNVQIFHLTNVITDNSSGWGQFYVGNLAEKGKLEPPSTTVYVDDVTVSETR